MYTPHTKKNVPACRQSIQKLTRGVCGTDLSIHAEFRVQGPGSRVQGSETRIQGSWFMVQGSGLRRRRQDLRGGGSPLGPQPFEVEVREVEREPREEPVHTLHLPIIKLSVIFAVISKFQRN